MDTTVAHAWDKLVRLALDEARVIRIDTGKEVPMYPLRFLAVRDDLAGCPRDGLRVEYHNRSAARRLLGSLPTAVVRGYQERATSARAAGDPFWLAELS